MFNIFVLLLKKRGGHVTRQKLDRDGPFVLAVGAWAFRLDFINEADSFFLRKRSSSMLSKHVITLLHADLVCCW